MYYILDKTQGKFKYFWMKRAWFGKHKRKCINHPCEFHQPQAGNKPQTYSFTLDRTFGVVTKNGSYQLSSPLENATGLEGKSISYGNSITISLNPGEVKIVEFTENN